MKCCAKPIVLVQRSLPGSGGFFSSRFLSSHCLACGHIEVGRPSFVMRVLRAVFGPDFLKEPEPMPPRDPRDIRKKSPFDPANPYNKKEPFR